MPCCVFALVALALPRIALLLIWLFTDWLARAYETWIIPLLGFVLMPYTTLAYMGAMLNNNHTVSGWWLALVVVAVLVDIGHWGGGFGARRR